MGTSGSYKGSGSKAGKQLRQQIAEWLSEQEDNTSQRKPLPTEVIQPALGLLRPGRRSHGGNGGGVAGTGAGDRDRQTSRSGGGVQRSAHVAATTAGRAAAAAYAYASGDSETLDRLGLSYDDLRQLGDPLEVMRRIVDAACGAQSGAIEEDEQRFIASDIAEWVLEQSEAGSLPSPEEMTKKSIAVIVEEVIAVEVGEMARKEKWPKERIRALQHDIHEAADILANQAPIAGSGVTAEALSNTIEENIERLRNIIVRSEE